MLKGMVEKVLVTVAVVLFLGTGLGCAGQVAASQKQLKIVEKPKEAKLDRPIVS